MIHDWYFFKNVYSKDYCEKILAIARENVSKNYVDRYDKNTNKDVEVDVVQSEVFKDKLDHFFNLVNQANEESFGFDLFLRQPKTLNINNYKITLTKC